MVDKVIKDGCIGVLYSPGYGAGWYTWNTFRELGEALLYDPVLVNILENAKDTDYPLQEMEDYVSKTYPDVYQGGLDNLHVAWLLQGTKFVVNEYDGSESIDTMEEVRWHTA